jgi:hypothetical protein
MKIKFNKRIAVTTSTEVDVNSPLFYHDSYCGDESSSDTYGMISDGLHRSLYFFDDWNHATDKVDICVEQIKGDYQFSRWLRLRVAQAKYDDALSKALGILRSIE